MSHAPDPIPLHVIETADLEDFLQRQQDPARRWIAAMGFAARLGETLCVPDAGGKVAMALFGWGDDAARRRGRFHLAAAREALPPGRYRVQVPAASFSTATEALGDRLADYRFDAYKHVPRRDVTLLWPEDLDLDRVGRIAAAADLARDLINTPACDMGPDALEAACTALAEAHGAEITLTRGAEALHGANLPLIAAVGAASSRAPRLIDLRWGRRDAPKVTLIGKGVCFDTGGLNLKPGASMGLMKKDMGGAANAMALAQLVMASSLDIRLRLLVPAVENAVSGAAMRPGDILRSRAGLSVEVNNTDAEGRLVLADALSLGGEESPDLLVTLATLTGAARVALGPDVPPFFTDDAALASDLASAAERVADPLWRMPFWPPYETMIEPDIADLDNAPSGGQAGAITAALFLRRFVPRGVSYVHFDIYGWTPKALPGRPTGGACQAIRALFEVLEARA